MKYKVLDMPSDFLKDTSESLFVRQSLYYISGDEALIRTFFDADELYPISQSVAYQKVVMEIERAVASDKKILISGDYDCDGICATTLLYRYIKSKHENVAYYIPHRKNDGYGLSVKLVDMYADKGYSIIICVDNGVVAHEAIAHAKELGIEVIILDHHEMDELTATYEYVLHPTLMEEPYMYLCGTGVVLEVLRSLKEIDQYDIILAALAAVSDMMVLAYENRRVVRLGLRYLNQNRDIHLTMLAEGCDTIDETTLAMRIAPKINAVGRMYDLANANNLIKYLLSQNTKEIADTSSQILRVNEERRRITRSITNSVVSGLDLDNTYLLVADHIHEGIVGLIASNLVNTYDKVSIVLSEEDGIYKGSCRSAGGVDLVDMMRNCPLLETFGGHKQAGGLALKSENLEPFKEYVGNYLATNEVIEEERYIIDLTDLSVTLNDILRLSSLRPYLRVQSEPLYAFHHLPFEEASLMKEGKHAKWNIGEEAEIIYFNVNDEVRNRNDATYVCKAGINEFRGRKKISFTVIDYFF